jgi:hypothetical protein
MSEPQRKRALVLCPFNDVGTGEKYEAGATVMIDAGAFENYEHAGLVSAPSAVDEDAEARSTTKSSVKAK